MANEQLIDLFVEKATTLIKTNQNIFVHQQFNVLLTTLVTLYSMAHAGGISPLLLMREGMTQEDAIQSFTKYVDYLSTQKKQFNLSAYDEDEKPEPYTELEGVYRTLWIMVNGLTNPGDITALSVCSAAFMLGYRVGVLARDTQTRFSTHVTYMQVAQLRAGIARESFITPKNWENNVWQLLLQLDIFKFPTNSDTPQVVAYAPLHLAVIRNDKNEVNRLLDNKADIQARTQDDESLSPLQLAAKHGFVSLYEDLAKKGATPEPTALHWAAKYGRSNMVKYLIEQPDADLNLRDAHGHTALYYALTNIEHQHPEPPKDRAESREILQQQTARQSTIYALFDAKPKLSDEDVSATHHVNRNSFLNILILNCQSYSRLHLFALDLLDNGKLDIKTPNWAGCTPLHHAVQNKLINISKKIIEKEPALLDVQDFAGTTPRALLLNSNLKFLIPRTPGASEPPQQGQPVPELRLPAILKRKTNNLLELTRQAQGDDNTKNKILKITSNSPHA